MENNIDDGRGSVFDGDAKNTSWFLFFFFTF